MEKDIVYSKRGKKTPKVKMCISKELKLYIPIYI